MRVSLQKEGKVTRPESGQADSKVTLTATVKTEE